ERLHADPELSGRLLRVHRGRHAAKLQAARRERGEQVGDGGARAEPDAHAVLDELRGRFGGQLLLPLDIHVPASSVSSPHRRDSRLLYGPWPGGSGCEGPRSSHRSMPRTSRTSGRSCAGCSTPASGSSTSTPETATSSRRSP